jgi:hypothetical protein
MYLLDLDDCVEMIGHDHEFIERYVGADQFCSIPFLSNDRADRGHSNIVIDDLSKVGMLVLAAYRDEIAARIDVIPVLQPIAFHTVSALEAARGMKDVNLGKYLSSGDGMQRSVGFRMCVIFIAPDARKWGSWNMQDRSGRHAVTVLLPSTKCDLGFDHEAIQGDQVEKHHTANADYHRASSTHRGGMHARSGADSHTSYPTDGNHRNWRRASCCYLYTASRAGYACRARQERPGSDQW